MFSVIDLLMNGVYVNTNKITHYKINNMPGLFNIKDKVVVLTGGAGILGKGMAEYLASEGAKIVILDRNAEDGEKLVNSITENGGEALFLETDVLSKEKLLENKAAILKQYGKVDVLLNAAGGNMQGATIPPEKTI